MEIFKGKTMKKTILLMLLFYSGILFAQEKTFYLKSGDKVPSPPKQIPPMQLKPLLAPSPSIRKILNRKKRLFILNPATS